MPDIIFQTDGTAECLYTDLIPLHELGQLRIQRASSIEWSDDAQEWIVYDRAGGAVYSDARRDRCLQWEDQHAEQLIATAKL